jgi:hypothetical protein
LHTLISAYNPGLEGNCPHSQNLSLPYICGDQLEAHSKEEEEEEEEDGY